MEKKSNKFLVRMPQRESSYTSFLDEIEKKNIEKRISQIGKDAYLEELVNSRSLVDSSDYEIKRVKELFPELKWEIELLEHRKAFMSDYERENNQEWKSDEKEQKKKGLESTQKHTNNEQSIEQVRNESETNWGCIIAVSIFMIINLIYLFSGKETQTLYGFGALIISFAFGGGLFYIFSKNGSKQSGSNKTDSFHNHDKYSIKEDTFSKGEGHHHSNSRIGCFVGAAIIAIAIITFNLIMSNSDLVYIIGSIGAIVLAIAIGFYFYNASKD